MTTLLNYSICRLGHYLHELNKEKSSLGASQTANFQNALRKMNYVRFGSIMMTIFAVSYQVGAPGSAGEKMSKPFTPIFYDNTKFNVLVIISPTLCCLLHSLMLYMVRRPQPKSGGSSEKTKGSKESTPGPQSRTRPSTASSYVDLKEVVGEMPAVPGFEVATIAPEVAKLPVEAPEVAKIDIAENVETAVRTEACEV